MKSPRALDDLPFSAELRPFPGASGAGGSLEPEGDYDRVLFSGSQFTDANADGARFVECAFAGGAGFDGGRLRRARLSDVWFGETRLVAADLAETSLTDAWFSGCVLAGVQAFSSVARRVLLRGCKLDSVNFRDTRLTDVVFEDCVLRDVDFGSAKLLRVRFTGSQLSGVDFTRASCKDVDLRGARLGSEDTPGIKAGYDSLAGVTIDMPQLMTIAPLLAHHLGITVAL
ncbi:MAG TPA: pentapeptide repeat-containing protein [Trebonia sp.]